jgi:O-antigen/teichoic acid export membrane protein
MSRAVAGNVARLTAVRYLSLFGGFLASVLGARLLGAEGMGIVGLVITVGLLGAVISSAGLSLSAVYFLSRSTDGPRVTVGRLLVLGVIATLVAFAIVGLLGLALSSLLPDMDRVILLAAPLSASILAFDLGGAILLGLTSETAYIWLAVAEALFGLVLTAVILLFVAATPAGFLVATTLAYAAAGGLGLAIIRRRVGPIHLGWDGVFTRQVLAFGLRGQIGNVLSFLNSRLDLLLVSSFIGLTAAGLYYVAVRISEAVFIVAQAGGTLLYPRVAAQLDRTSTEATESLVRATLLVVGAGALGVVLLGEPFIRIVFGESFAGAVWAARIVAVAMLPFTVHRLLVGDMRGRGRPGLVSASSAIALGATVVLDLVLIPPFGIVGAAVASLVAYSIAAAAMVAFFLRETGVSVRELIPTWRDVQALLRRGVSILATLRR